MKGLTELPNVNKRAKCQAAKPEISLIEMREPFLDHDHLSKCSVDQSRSGLSWFLEAIYMNPVNRLARITKLFPRPQKEV